MADIFQTSVSGMLAFQQALGTTAHNINNLHTDGYSRQRTELTTLTPGLTTGGWMGTGVGVASIRRIVDESRINSLRNNASEFGRLDTFAELSGRIDGLLADKNAGLSPALQSFFNAVQTASADPTSSTSRDVLLTEANNLTSRFRTLDTRLQELDDEVNQRIDAATGEINQLAEGVARLNQDIVVALGRSQGEPPNDLLDKRDALLKQLSDRVTTRVVMQDDGAANVFIGNGQALVVGNTSNTVQTIPNAYDGNRLEVAFNINGTLVNITRNLTGGVLGGLLDFRRENLDVVRNELGQLATSLATQFNDQHALGVAFDNGTVALGGAFFNLTDPEVLPHRSNTATGAPVVTVDNATVSDLTASDYRLGFDGTAWTVTRLSDNSAVGTITPPATTATIDGLDFDLSGIAGAVSGDSFLIRPTQGASQGVSVALTRASQIAYANPVLTAEATDAQGQATNDGTGRIGAATVGSTQNLPLAGNITLTFDAAANQFNVVGGPGGTLAYNPATDSGGVEFNFAAYGDMSFTISGVPADGDSFVISANVSARGDNANLLQLAGLRNTDTMEGGTVNYKEFYASAVGRVGTVTARANINRDAQEVLLNQAQAARDETSGVNLEEEAANMLKFQQAFQASAQMVTAANTIFDALLAAVGR